MRTVGFILWSLVLTGAVQAQELRGGYLMDTPEGVLPLSMSAIWFGDGRFEWIVAGCATRDINTGRYFREGNNLIFCYDDWQQPISSYQIVASTRANSAEFEVITLDAETGDSLEVFVGLSRPSQPPYFLQGRRVLFTSSDAIEPHDTDSISVNADIDARISQYIPAYISFGQIRGRCLLVFLARKQFHPPGGTAEKFTIRAVPNGAIQLRHNNTNSIMRYSPMSREAARIMFFSAK